MKKLRKIVRPFQEFFNSEVSSGITLIFNTIIALAWANSALAPLYDQIIQYPVTIGVGIFSLTKPLLLWINDGLMAIFFLAVGMEIKREILVGELSSIKKSALPIGAALGGMIVPALIFTFFNYDLKSISGWGIPMATDIAFALGALSLLGRGIPKVLAVFLTALAIVDDLGAVLVIALFYTADISLKALLIGGAFFLALILLNRVKVTWIPLYLLFGIGMWVAFVKSGVHATVAGVLLGMTIPAKGRNNEEVSPLHKLEHFLVPWVTFGIMPIFALANAGVAINLSQLSEILFQPVTLGIIGGLFIGKQLGITGFSYLMVKLGLASLPEKVTWKQLYGVSLLGGIGFTMSIFIASLAFTDSNLLATSKIAIITASLLSGIAGIAVLKITSSNKSKFEAKNQKGELS